MFILLRCEAPPNTWEAEQKGFGVRGGASGNCHVRPHFIRATTDEVRMNTEGVKGGTVVPTETLYL